MVTKTVQTNADALGHQVGRICPCLGQDKCKLVPAETRRSIDIPTTDAQDISQPAKRLTASHMAVAVEALLQGKTFFLPAQPSGIAADANAPASNAKEELATAEEAKPESHRNHP